MEPVTTQRLSSDDTAFGAQCPCTRNAPVSTSESSRSVVTRMRFDAPLEKVWEGLLFYEQIDEPPPWYLRLLLPRPLGTEGAKSAVGDEAKCQYESGHLVKRVTQITPYRHYGFEVIEQRLAVLGGIILSGGCYALREVPDRGTEVAVSTRYVSRGRPHWLRRPVEATICHMFHRHLLRAMRRGIEQPATP
jgi:hypothetical protein